MCYRMVVGDMEATSKRIIDFRRTAVGICMLACLQAAGLLPALLAIGVWLEGSHQVSVAGRAERVAVVLHHPHARPSDSRVQRMAAAPHAHGLASMILCTLGATNPGELADHVASFNATTRCELTASAPKPNSVESLHPISAKASGGAPSGTPLTSASLVSTLSELPSAASLGALRTTVLII